MRRPRAAPAALALLAVAWEVAGRLDLVAGGALPAPSEIAARLVEDAADYPPHLLATARAAALGFLVGNLAAVAAALACALLPAAERALRGINVTLFALPPITLTPILVIALQGDGPRIALAAVSVYFPTFVATLIGLRGVDPRLLDVVAAAGGGPWQALLRVRLRACLPGLMAGLQVAAPAAVLGSILAEFGGGARWGLGSYLLGSLGRADPPRLWGIGLSATALAGAGYALFGALGRRLAEGAGDVTLAANRAPEDIAGAGRRPAAAGLLDALVATAVTLLVWQGAVAALGLSPIVVYGPAQALDYLVLSPRAGEAWGRLLPALAQTLPVALLGLAAGIGVALALALLGRAAPAATRVLAPIALVSQTMPLVALTPLIVLLFGRTLEATLVVTTSVTFFPAFVLIQQGLASAPRAAHDVLDVYGASVWRKIRLVDLPNAVPHLTAAARLAAPRAILGVMIAEWLATGYGLGALLNQSRGRLDYGMIWSVAIVSVILSIALYQALVLVEHRARRRFG